MRAYITTKDGSEIGLRHVENVNTTDGVLTVTDRITPDFTDDFTIALDEVATLRVDVPTLP